jgi:hypothetical protein
MQADNFRHLFHIVEMTLHSIFDHLTQIGKSHCRGSAIAIGFVTAPEDGGKPPAEFASRTIRGEPT